MVSLFKSNQMSMIWKYFRHPHLSHLFILILINPLREVSPDSSDRVINTILEQIKLCEDFILKGIKCFPDGPHLVQSNCYLSMYFLDDSRNGSQQLAQINFRCWCCWSLWVYFLSDLELVTQSYWLYLVSSQRVIFFINKENAYLVSRDNTLEVGTAGWVLDN